MLVGILSILAAAGLTLVDQLIKLWATVELLPVGSKPFIPHVLEFYYLLNDGMSFSMLSGKRTLLVIVTGVMLAVLAGMLLLRKMPRLERAAWILVVGGGVGNLIDRSIGRYHFYFSFLVSRITFFCNVSNWQARQVYPHASKT